MAADSKRDVSHPFSVQGVTGLKHWAGMIDEEWEPTLKGPKGVAVYREMRDNDPITGSVLFAMEHTLRGVEWYVTPFSDPDEDPTDEDQEVAQFVESCMHDMSITWADFIAEVLSKLVFGWAYAEIVYKRREGYNSDIVSRHEDGKIGWRTLSPRAQETLLRWQFDDSGELVGMVQNDGKQGVLIPLDDALHFRTSSHKQNPEGRSLLRTSYSSWWTKKRIERFEAIGIERDLAGIPCVGVPPELFDSDADADTKSSLANWQKMVTSLKNDEQAGILYPKTYDEQGNPLITVELLSAPSSRMYDTGSIIERLSRYQAMTVLQDVILLGHESVGSLALADTKKRLARASLKSQADEISATLNQYAIADLLRLNGMPTDRLPRIVSGEIEERSLDTFASMMSALAISGVMLDDLETQNEIRGILGLRQITQADLESREEFEPSVEDPQSNLDRDEALIG